MIVDNVINLVLLWKWDCPKAIPVSCVHCISYSYTPLNVISQLSKRECPNAITIIGFHCTMKRLCRWMVKQPNFRCNFVTPCHVVTRATTPSVPLPSYGRESEYWHRMTHWQNNPVFSQGDVCTLRGGGSRIIDMSKECETIPIFRQVLRVTYF